MEDATEEAFPVSLLVSVGLSLMFSICAFINYASKNTNKQDKSVTVFLKSDISSLPSPSPSPSPISSPSKDRLSNQDTQTEAEDHSPDRAPFDGSRAVTPPSSARQLRRGKKPRRSLSGKGTPVTPDPVEEEEVQQETRPTTSRRRSMVPQDPSPFQSPYPSPFRHNTSSSSSSSFISTSSTPVNRSMGETRRVILGGNVETRTKSSLGLQSPVVHRDDALVADFAIKVSVCPSHQAEQQRILKNLENLEEQRRREEEERRRREEEKARRDEELRRQREAEERRQEEQRRREEEQRRREQEERVQRDRVHSEEVGVMRTKVSAIDQITRELNGLLASFQRSSWLPALSSGTLNFDQVLKETANFMKGEGRANLEDLGRQLWQYVSRTSRRLQASPSSTPLDRLEAVFAILALERLLYHTHPEHASTSHPMTVLGMLFVLYRAQTVKAIRFILRVLDDQTIPFLTSINLPPPLASQNLPRQVTDFRARLARDIALFTSPPFLEGRR